MRRGVRTRGVAMIVALMAMVVVAGIATLMFARTVNEMRHSRDDAAIVQTLLLARAGANVGTALLGQDVRHRLRDAAGAVAGSERWIFGHGTGDEPDAVAVANDLDVVVDRLQPEVDALVCGRSIAPTGTSGRATLRIHFTETACGRALPRGVELTRGRFVGGPARGEGRGVQEYALPFVLVAEGSLGENRRSLVVQGEYRFEVGRASFSMYAYFTNSEEGAHGERIWFTERTMIDGPVHTNGHFAFAGDPWFGGRVTSAGCTSTLGCDARADGAYFHGYRRCEWEFLGWCVGAQELIDAASMTPDPAAPALGGNRPGFADGVDWEAEHVPLPANNADQRAVARGEARADAGLFFGDDLASLTLWAGDGQGDPPSGTGGDGRPAAAYQYLEACRSGDACTRYRFDSAGALQAYDPEQDRWTTRPEPFNGVLFVDGDVDRFRGPGRSDAADAGSAPPAVAAFAGLTLAAEGNVRIAGDLTYERPPCEGSPVRHADRDVTPAACEDLDVRNVLGVYAQGGDVLVGNGHRDDPSLDAPDDVRVHAVLMSGSGRIRVEAYDDPVAGDRGNFHLLGGMIQERRGAFGTFDPSGWDERTGYDRVYTYDPRMREGVAPPFFPTTDVDEVGAVRVFSFGQREQLY